MKKTKFLKRAACISFLYFLGAVRVEAGEISPPRTFKGIPYRSGKEADPERHILDLYVPEGEVPFPVIVWIYGAGFTISDSSNREALGRRFTESGIGIAFPNHRLSSARWMRPKATGKGVLHPAHVEDCAEAFAWVHAHIKEYGGDPDRLFVGGHSSGACVAALLAMDPRYLARHALRLDDIKGAAPVEGAYDFVHAQREVWKKRGKNSFARCVFGVDEDGVVLREASPAHYLAESKVPMLVIAQDTPGSPHRLYLERFRELVEQAKAPNIRFMEVPSRNHMTIRSEMDKEGVEPVRDAITAFIRKRCEVLENVGGPR